MSLGKNVIASLSFFVSPDTYAPGEKYTEDYGVLVYSTERKEKAAHSKLYYIVREWFNFLFKANIHRGRRGE